MLINQSVMVENQMVASNGSRDVHISKDAQSFQAILPLTNKGSTPCHVVHDLFDTKDKES